MKNFLRSLLIPPKPAQPSARRPGPPARKAEPPPPAPAPSLEGLDERPTAMILRDMIRAKLDDPDYAKRFADGLRRMLRDGR